MAYAGQERWSSTDTPPQATLFGDLEPHRVTVTTITPEPAEPPQLESVEVGDAALAEAAADRRRFGYNPALDGIRALAVLGVLLYHGSVSWARGGYLGVDVFFALSGYLITTLLVLENDDTGRVDFLGFWTRRARRLLPALFAVVLVVALYAAFAASAVELSGIRGDSIASLLYFANWHFIFSSQSYFAQFAAPSPLRHTWSLAIEEQWYLIWPLVLTASYRLVRGNTRRLALYVLAAALASATVMSALFHPGTDPSRVYYGTDTRAQGLLIGAALALVLHKRTFGTAWRRAFQLLGIAGLVGMITMFAAVPDNAGWMYHGGFTLIALITCAVIVTVVQPQTTSANRILGVAPLAFIGRISYGLYLWHWPVFVFLNSDRTHLSGIRLLALRLDATLGIALVSYYLIEMPVRQGKLRRLAVRISHRRPGWILTTATITTMLVVAALAIGVTGTSAPAQATYAQSPGAPRILVVGDSVAFGLAWALPREIASRANIYDGGMIGCGVLRSQPKRTEGHDYGCQTRLASWQRDLDQFHPDLSIQLQGAYEVFDQRVGQTTYRFGSDAFAKYYQDELALNARTLSAKGGAVVYLTTPCQFERPAGGLASGALERRDPKRTAWLNGQLREFAKSNPSVRLLDLASYLCPNGRFRPEINGVKLYRDGLHFTPAGAKLVWEWLLPRLSGINSTAVASGASAATIVEKQATVAPGGGLRLQLTCGPGEKASNGDALVDDPRVVVLASRPVARDPSSWEIGIKNRAPTATQVFGYAFCRGTA